MTDLNPENPPTKIAIALRTFIVFIILAASIALATYFITTPAKTEKKNTQDSTEIFVETTPIALGNYPVKIEAMGQVRPARETALKAQVSGAITTVSDNFIPGGFIKAQDDILSVDQANYALDIKIKAAALRQAQAKLTLEQGQQAIAKDELKILEQSIGKQLKSSDLALRKPQLEQARADIATAQANLELSELNLARTTLRAPFNALITERFTNLGNVISTQDVLATLVSTDEYWINVDIPVRAIQWLNIPVTSGEPASEAQVTLDSGRGVRTGKLLKVTGSINPQSHLASLIVSVPDPLLLNEKDTKKPRMVLGDYVQLTLIGKMLENAARVPQSYIRDGREIWLERDGKLVIQPVTIAYEDREFSYIVAGVNANDHVVTSNIITPVSGMDITVHNSNSPQLPAPEKQD